MGFHEAHFRVIPRRDARGINFNQFGQRPSRDPAGLGILVFLVGFVIDNDTPSVATGVLAIRTKALKALKIPRLNYVQLGHVPKGNTGSAPEQLISTINAGTQRTRSPRIVSFRSGWSSVSISHLLWQNKRKSFSAAVS